MNTHFVSCDANTTFQQSSVYNYGARWSTIGRRQSQPVGNGGTKWLVHKCRVSVNPLLCCGAGSLADGISITLVTLFFVVFVDFRFAFGMCAYSTEEKRRGLNSWKERMTMSPYFFFTTIAENVIYSSLKSQHLFDKYQPEMAVSQASRVVQIVSQDFFKAFSLASHTHFALIMLHFPETAGLRKHKAFPLMASLLLLLFGKYHLLWQRYKWLQRNGSLYFGRALVQCINLTENCTFLLFRIWRCPFVFNLRRKC